jgi:phosphohistidine phosphatase
MKRLILFRHGEAERPQPGQQDIERNLNESGRDETQAVAAALARAGVAPDLVLVSSANRTRQTWTAMAGTFDGAAEEIDPGLYHADAEGLMQAAGRPDADTVMIVAHNPSIHHLALYLAQASDPAIRRKLERNFPTGGAAVFVFETERRATCEAVIFPRDAR